MNGKIVLAAIVKDEGDYIEEFVDYHLCLGFDQIIIGDNNDISGENYTYLLDDFIKEKSVRIVNLRGKKAAQLEFYDSIVKEGGYEWCAFIDCDEFLTFGERCGYDNIRDFLNARPTVNAYKVNWMLYGDSGKVRMEDGDVTERFTKPLPLDFKYTYDFPENCHCKSILRGSVKGRFYSPHNIPGVKYYAPNGMMTDDSPFNKQPDYSTLYIRHYYTKSLQEWAEKKMGKGYADMPTDKKLTYGINRYYAYNGKTDEMKEFLKENRLCGYGINEDTDIFIYSHKPFVPVVTNPVYKILTNSHDEFSTDMEVIRDYTGDNIADKNLMYNEYTGFYWLWKNYRLKDYVGMNHYRRYYSWADEVPEIGKLFRKHSMVINRPIYFQESLKREMDNRSWYDYWHNVEDYDLFVDMMRKEYPEYNDGLEKMMKADYLYNSSMFIMRKEDFLEYCEYIFDVLDKYMEYRGIHTVEESIASVESMKDKYLKPDLPYYTVEIQARILGYIAERAMNIYVMNGKNSLEKKAYVEPWFMPKG